MIGRVCPTHPRFAVDDCPFCARKIERAEAMRADDPGDDVDAARTARYERWLDRFEDFGP